MKKILIITIAIIFMMFMIGTGTIPYIPEMKNKDIIDSVEQRFKRIQQDSLVTVKIYFLAAEGMMYLEGLKK